MDIVKSINGLRVATRDDIDSVREKLKDYFPDSALIYNSLMGLTAYEGLWDLLETKIYYSDNSTLVVGTPCLHKIKEFVESRMLGNGSVKSEHLYESQLFAMTSLPDVELTVPEGFEIRNLGEEHAEFASENWEVRPHVSLEYYKCLCKELPSVALFKKKDNPKDRNYKTAATEDAPETSDNPVAWTQLCFASIFRNTFTVPQYRRLGLASVVTLALAKESLQRTGMAVATISLNNEASVAMHLKLGFSQMCPIASQFCMSSPWAKSRILSLNGDSQGNT